MATYRTRKLVQLDDGAVFAVESDKTFYRVALRKGTCYVFGPGVEEEYTLGEEIPEELSSEHQALLAVLLWEDQV